MGADHATTSMCRGNLGLIKRADSVNHAGREALDASANQEHGQVRACGRDDGCDETEDSNDLDRSATTDFVGKPAEGEATKQTSSAVDTVHG